MGDSPVWRDIVQHQHSLSDLAKALDQAVDSADAAIKGSVSVATSMREIEVFAEFRYGDRVLANGLFVTPGVPVSVAAVLYTGAPLDEQRFRALLFSAGGATTAECLVIVNPPLLSDLESEVMRAIPIDDGENHLATIPRVVPAVAATIAARAAAGRGAAWAAQAVGAAGVGWGVGKGLDAAWARIRGGRHARVDDGQDLGDAPDPPVSVSELLDARMAAIRSELPSQSEYE